jgi:hypothetical protein
VRSGSAKQAAPSIIVAVILLIAALGYVLLVQRFGASNEPVERRFSNVGKESEFVQLYIEAVSVDAPGHSMQMRVTLTPSPAIRGLLITAPNRDLTLVLTHGETVQELRFPANTPARPATFEVTLDEGDVADYPLDTYHADLGLECFAQASPATGDAKPLPAEITVREELLGFQLETTKRPGNDLGEVHFTLKIRRSGAFSVFALGVYGAMAVIGLSALTISVLTFVGLRRAEATLVGALGAIVFALPALRNSLPGAPPFGVRADLLIFLWTELAAAIALALMVCSWARTGPRP